MVRFKSGREESAGNDVNHLQVVIRNRIGRFVHDFELTLVKGGLLIRGKARTYYGKQMAQEAVMELTDLPIIDNSIQVKRN
jgi:hypothetical protein